MKKSILALGFTFLLSGLCFAEHKTASLDSSYINKNSASSYKEWTGGYAPSEINTAEQIKDIGRRLGKGISYQENIQEEDLPFNKGNPAYKYSSARIYSSTKRGADVLLIGQTATVDTIKCLKLIIRGYLESAFGCTEMAARELAESICYWNTNNFGNTSFFKDEFESGVTEVFAGRYTNTGLSQNYKEWKQSIIIIPHEFTAPAVSYSEPAYTEPEPAYNEPAYEPEPAPAPQKSTSNYQSIKVDSKKPSSMLPLILGVLAAVVLVVVFLVILLKKKE